MENLEETLKKYPLIALIILLGAISCFAVASAAPIMTNIANPYMLWLKQGLYYVLGGALSYIIYKIGQDTLYTHIKTLYIQNYYIFILSHSQSLLMGRLLGITSRALVFSLLNS